MVSEVNFPTTFREPLWVPKRHQEIYLTLCKIPKTKNQYSSLGESINQVFVLSVLIYQRLS